MKSSAMSDHGLCGMRNDFVYLALPLFYFKLKYTNATNSL